VRVRKKPVKNEEKERKRSKAEKKIKPKLRTWSLKFFEIK
jgi:hypothetical protein